MPSPLRILFTGGRAPATLEWARLCAQSGHKVWLAESMPWTITSFSNTIECDLRVPSPRAQYADFIQQLLLHIKRHRIDLLIPTCEEVFWVARGKEQLQVACEVLTPALEQLRPMHSKIDFLAIAKKAQVSTPKTRRIVDLENLRKHFNKNLDSVLKPEFSRFGTQVLIRPSADKIAAVHPTPKTPWALQEWIAGRQYATWSLCRNGQILAHSVYPIDHSAGIGSAVFFRAINHPEILQCVERIVAETQWTGQIAFDFIVPDGAPPVVIECNPRLTSGIHLFRGQPELTQLFHADAVGAPLIPPQDVAVQLSLPMVLYALPRAISQRNVRRWLRDFFSAADAVWTRNDPIPTLGQVCAVLTLLMRSILLRKDPLSASTHDIEWNGESCP